MSTWLASKLGKIIEAGGLVNLIKKGAQKRIMGPIVGSALQAFNEQNEYIDLSTKETKSGVDKLVGDMMHTIGNKLSESKLPAVDSTRFFSGDGKVYLDYTLTKRVNDNLVDILNSLGSISVAGPMEEYRGKTTDLIKTIKLELEKYSKCFDTFIVEKKFKIIPVSVDYNKILTAKKRMIACLKKIEKAINDYKPELFTSAYVRKFLTIPDEVLRELDHDALVKAYALKYINEAIDYLKQYAGKEKGSNRSWWQVGGSIEDIKRNDDYDSKDQQALVSARQCVIGIERDNMSDADKLKTLGGVACLNRAKRELAPLENLGDMFSAAGYQVPKYLFGDYALKLRECIKHTLGRIDTVIRVGVKKKDLSSNNNPLMGVGLKILLGADYDEDVQKWSRREIVVDSSFDAKLLKNAISQYAKSKKEYERIRKQRDKVSDKSSDLYNLKLILPSKSGEDGKKGFEIEKRFEELTNDYKNTLNNRKDKNYAAVCFRKADKFLFACEQWNMEFKQYKDAERQRKDSEKVIAEDRIRDAKNHYKELLKKYAKDKIKQKSIKDTYKKIPSSTSKFIKDFDGNDEKVKEFIANSFD